MTEKTQIEIALLLPTVPDARDQCVQRLSDLLRANEGIEAAHLPNGNGTPSDQICIHYDPDQLSLSEVRELARRAGTELEQRFGHLLFKTEPMYAGQSRMVESRARQIPGVLEAAASPTGVLRIEFDRLAHDETAIRAAVQKIGVRILEAPETPPPASPSVPERQPAGKEHSHAHAGMFGERTELVFAVFSSGLLLTGWLLSLVTHVTPWVPWGLYLAAYGFGGVFMFREAIRDLIALRFDIDALMLLAAIGTALLGQWAEGALLLCLFSIGHGLEQYAMGRAKRAIEALAELAPQTALVRREGRSEEVPVELLRVRDVVIVKPNERLPADGFVIQGEGSVNQAPITGESVPVDKRAVDDPELAAANPDRLESQYRAFAGTINGSGALEIQVTKLASETTLARVVQMVNEAETQKSPTQRFADRFEKYFVPTVLAFVGLLLFAWTIIDERFSTSFYRAMAVLVAASPCALAISVPSAVLSGVARAARGGVLVKGGGPLDSAALVSSSSSSESC